MDTATPTPIRPLLDDYIRLLEQRLSGLVTGLYLHGSVALAAFNPALSDIDFIAFISRPPTTNDVEALRTIHQTIAISHPRWALEGSYLQWGDLGQLEDAIAPYPIYHDGKLEPAERFDVNSVTWWVLKQRGITLIGPNIQELAFEVDWDHLIGMMCENLNSYWLAFTRKPQRIAWLLTDYGIQWAVLGVLRQYYTFQEHDITSKTGAGEYALIHLPARWHRLIREAIQLREQAPGSLYQSKLVRAVEAYTFLRYVIRSSNALF